MTEEVGRRLIDGVWVTNVEAQGGSGGGGITRVTSDDETVTIINPTGPVVDLSAGGGSQPVAVVRVPITFDTPNIGTTGAALYTPALGDIISIAYVNNITPWNGTNPSGYCFAQGSGDPRGESIIGFDPTGTNTTSTPTFDIATNPFFGVAALIATAATPVVVAVLNSSDGSDPGATAGELELVLLVLKAS